MEHEAHYWDGILDKTQLGFHLMKILVGKSTPQSKDLLCLLMGNRLLVKFEFDETVLTKTSASITAMYIVL